MRKLAYISVLMLGAAIFTGCAGEEEDLFDHSAAERLNAVKQDYTQILQSSKGGWAMEYYPTNDTINPQGYGYLLLNKYETDGTVDVAMNNRFSDNVFRTDTSSWEIITDNGPVLTYNTYNKCMHAFSDPEDISFTTGSSENETGRGCEGDYEFVLLDMPKDGEFLMFKGKKRGTYIRMTRLPEGTDFREYIADVQGFHKTVFPSSAPNTCVLNLGGDSIMTLRNASTGMAGIYPVGKDAVTYETRHPFLITKRDGKYYMRFENAMKASDGSDVQEFVYDDKVDKFASVENAAYTIEGENPDTFFVAALNDNRSWKFDASSSMSESAKTILAAANKGFSALNAGVNDVSFKMSGADLICSLRYKYKKGNRQATVKYKFSFAPSEKGITLKYVEPSDTPASNTLNNVSGVKELIEMFAGDYELSGGINNFVLSKIKLAASADKWFVLSYN